MRLPSRSGFHYPDRPNVITEEQFLERSIYDEKHATLAKLQWAIAVLEYRAFRFDEAEARVAQEALKRRREASRTLPARFRTLL